MCFGSFDTFGWLFFFLLKGGHVGAYWSRCCYTFGVCFSFGKRVLLGRSGSDGSVLGVFVTDRKMTYNGKGLDHGQGRSVRRFFPRDAVHGPRYLLLLCSSRTAIAPSRMDVLGAS